MDKILEFFYGKAWKQIDEFIQKNKLQYIYFYIAISIGLVIAVTFIVSWYVANKKIKSEIEKNKIEYKEKYMDLLERVGEQRKVYLQSDISLQDSIRLLINDVTNASNNDYWNETAHIFYNNYLESFNAYLSYYRLLLDMDIKEAKYFVDDELFKFLDTVVEIYNTMNCEDIKRIYPNTNLIVSLELTKYVFRTIKRYISIIDFKRRYKYLVYKYKMKKIAPT